MVNKHNVIDLVLSQKVAPQTLLKKYGSIREKQVSIIHWLCILFNTAYIKSVGMK